MSDDHNFKTRKPDMLLKVKMRKGHGETVVGRGWAKVEDGVLVSVSIQLNPCVVISSHDDVFITLFPRVDE